MNPHSLRSHSRSPLRNDTHYLSTSHNNARYNSTIHRPRAHNMSQHYQHHQQVSHAHHRHSPSHQSASWTAPTMVPPPVLQEVYILDCKSCDTFLTNRGMRAVLLLQPEVPLYSTDALPVNCSANPGPLEYVPSYQTTAISSPALSCPSGMPAPLPRTCECLTQTLCCHGCGNAVGYMVVIPCNRCCSSVSPTNRHTNRHRFVFFNKEITASERHYVPHEPGIITTSPLLVSALTPSSSVSSSSSLHDSDGHSSPSAFHHTLPRSQHHVSAIGPVPPLPTPPPDSPMSIDYTSQALNTSPPDQNTRQHPSFPSFQFVVFKPERGKLRAGDVVYWHNLAKHGEIPAVVEDERARDTHQLASSAWAGR